MRDGGRAGEGLYKAEVKGGKEEGVKVVRKGKKRSLPTREKTGRYGR